MANIDPLPVTQPNSRSRGTAADPGLSVWAIASGILGLAGAACLLGLIFGPLGIVLSLIAIAKPTESRIRIAIGLGLSTIALFVSIAAAITGFSTLRAPNLQAWEGVQAPDFTLRTSDGNSLRLSDLRGKIVFIDVWATWCPPCIDSIPHLEKIAGEGVAVLGLSTDDSETLAKFLNGRPVAYPTGVMDAEIPKPYRSVNLLPTLFVVDRNGVIVAVESGYHTFEEFKMMTRLPDYPNPPLPPPGTQPESQ